MGKKITIEKKMMPCLICKGKKEMFAFINMTQYNTEENKPYTLFDDYMVEKCPRCNGTGKEPYIVNNHKRIEEATRLYAQYYERYFESDVIRTQTQIDILEIL